MKLCQYLPDAYFGEINRDNSPIIIRKIEKLKMARKYDFTHLYDTEKEAQAAQVAHQHSLGCAGRKASEIGLLAGH